MKHLFFLFFICIITMATSIAYAQDGNDVSANDQYGGCGEDFCGQNPTLCHSTICDDGTEILCDETPPTCPFGEILAYQHNCFQCVNPLTCLPKSKCGGERKVPCLNRHQICWYETGKEPYGTCVDQVDDKPVCQAIGSRSEGWYWQKKRELIQWAQCESEMAACYLEPGNKSQGWYLVGEAPGSDTLIVWDNCAK